VSLAITAQHKQHFQLSQRMDVLVDKFLQVGGKSVAHESNAIRKWCISRRAVCESHKMQVDCGAKLISAKL
jgi:hypothetical protein